MNRLGTRRRKQACDRARLDEAAAPQPASRDQLPYGFCGSETLFAEAFVFVACRRCRGSFEETWPSFVVGAATVTSSAGSGGGSIAVIAGGGTGITVGGAAGACAAILAFRSGRA